MLTLLGAKCWHYWDPSIDIIESLVLTFNEPIGSIVLTLLGANWEWWHYWEPSASKKRSSTKLRVTSRSGWHGCGAVWEVQVAKYFKYQDYVQNVIANTFINQILLAKTFLEVHPSEERLKFQIQIVDKFFWNCLKSLNFWEVQIRIQILDKYIWNCLKNWNFCECKYKYKYLTNTSGNVWKVGTSEKCKY